MGDIVYWGNGGETLGEYTAPKDVSSAIVENLPSDQIKVDWGGEDIEIVSGTSWAITSGTQWARTSDIFYSPPINAAFSCVNNISSASLILAAPNRRFRMKILRPDTGAIWDTTSLSVLGDRPQIRWSNFVLQGCSNSTQNRSRGLILRPDGVVRTNTSITSPTAGQGWYPVFVEEQYSVWVKVEADTGAYSLRETTIPPNVSIQNGSCAISITYTDGTTEELPLDYCPPWVRIRSDQECPDGTCSVDCPDHVCCYDCSGVAVLVIPK